VAESVGAVHVSFSADTAAFRSEVARAGESVRNFSTEAKRAATQARANTVTAGTQGAAFGKLGQHVKGAAASVSGFSQAVALMGSKAAPAVKGLGSAVSALAAGGFTPLGVAIGLATAAIGHFVSKQDEATKAAEKHVEKLKEQAEELKRFKDRADEAQDKLSGDRTRVDPELVEIDRKIAAASRGFAYDTGDAANSAELASLREKRMEVVRRIDAEKLLTAELRRRELLAEIAKHNDELPLEQAVSFPALARAPATDVATAQLQVRALEELAAKQRELIEIEKLRAKVTEERSKETTESAEKAKKAASDSAKEFQAAWEAEVAAYNERSTKIEQISLAARTKLASATRNSIDDDRAAVNEKFDLIENEIRNEIEAQKIQTDGEEELTERLKALRQARADELAAIDAKAAADAEQKRKADNEKLEAEIKRFNEQMTDAVRALNVDLAAQDQSETERQVIELRGRYAELIEDRKKHNLDVVALEEALAKRIAFLRRPSLSANRAETRRNFDRTLDDPDASFGAGVAAQMEVVRANLLSIGETGAATADIVSTGFADAFADFAAGTVTAGEAFRNFAAGVLQDIARMIAKQLVFNAISAGLGGLFGGGAEAGAEVVSMYDAEGLIEPVGYASGGSFRVRGTGGTDSSLVAFKASPGEEVNVRTPGQMAKGGGASVVVNVHNYSNAKATTSERTGPGGTREIEVLIEEVVAGSISRGGKVGRALEREHGLRRGGRRG